MIKDDPNEETPEEETQKRTLLLVDDERDSLDPMELLLKEQYNVLTAQSGVEALDILKKNDIDIVIADQRMPGMTGVELLVKVKELYPGIVRVVLTAYTDFEAMIKAINEGSVYRYIIKPWDVDDMRLVIKQALEFKDLRAAKGELAADLAAAHQALAKTHEELTERHKELMRAYSQLAMDRITEAIEEETDGEGGEA